MRSRVPVVLPFLFVAMPSGCGGAPPPAPAPDVASGSASASASAPASASASASAPCPFSWSPRELRASVMVIPAEQAGRMMDPLYRALCACTRPGQSIYVVARMLPERGEVTAQTVDRPELAAGASASVDACLAAQLEGQHYEPFEVGSDLVCPRSADPPPRAPGEPAPFRPPRPACAGTQVGTAKISYPLHVDRRGEAR